jgi:cell division topological specificity factor
MMALFIPSPILSLFRGNGTAPIARERLQMLIAKDRATLDGIKDPMGAMRDEISEVVARYMGVERRDVRVSTSRGGPFQVEIEVNKSRLRA